MKQPPGLQLLHCLDASDEGGKSFFCDSFAAARDLYMAGSEGRKFFNILTEFPVPYHYNQPHKAFFDRKVTIEADPRLGEGLASPRINFVNWSPPFQAPFWSNKKVLPEITHDFRQYHQAAQAFHRALHAEKRIFELMLEPGRCVIFNNRRILHGRRAFTSHGTQPRWLKGAYLDTDDFESQIRWLNRNEPTDVPSREDSGE